MSGARYIEMDAGVLGRFMSEHGFAPMVQGNEVVYVRPNIAHPSVQVKVYSSVQAGHAVARPCGQDAIRVVTVYVGPKAIQTNRGMSSNFCVHKTAKVLRTGSQEAVLERLLGRMRDAYRAGNQWLREHWVEVCNP